MEAEGCFFIDPRGVMFIQCLLNVGRLGDRNMGAEPVHGIIGIVSQHPTQPRRPATG